jgi:hypothetical protein
MHLSVSYPLAFVAFHAVDWDRRGCLFQQAVGKTSSLGSIAHDCAKEAKTKRQRRQ